MVPLLVALGDSITYGWALPHPSTQNYAALYARRTGDRLVNLAVPGYTCAQVRVRLARMPGGAATVILNCGTNDIGGFGATKGHLPTGHHRIPPATTSELFSAEKDYEDIVSTIRRKEPRARIIVLTIRHWQRMTGPEDPRFAKDVTTWNAMIRKSGVNVVDIAADPRMYQGAYFKPDLIHPNAAGNAAIANDVLAAQPK
jgi:lysophospholipase L1-like esterase